MVAQYQLNVNYGEKNSAKCLFLSEFGDIIRYILFGRKEMKVLFLGNSHTYYNDLPMLFANICRQKGKDVEVAMLAHPGVSYEWHIAQFTDLRFALMHGGFDYIFMQQAAHEPCPTREETLRDAKQIVKMARLYGVTPIQTLPWARLDIPEEQEVMDKTYSLVAEENDVALNPVGRVFEYIRKNHPDISVHWFDGAHSSPYGSYANALCSYAMLFGCDLDGISDESYDSYPVDGDTAVMVKDELAVTLDPEKAENIRKAVAFVFSEK